jgi:hypothetical protein
VRPPSDSVEPTEPAAPSPSAHPPIPPQSQTWLELQFPTVMRYAGLGIALFEGFFDRPPQAIVVGLAGLMMAGAQALQKVVERRG